MLGTAGGHQPDSLPLDAYSSESLELAMWPNPAGSAGTASTAFGGDTGVDISCEGD